MVLRGSCDSSRPFLHPTDQRRRLPYAVLALATLVQVQAVPAAQTGQTRTVQVVSSQAVIRLEPAPSSPILARVPIGTVLETSASEGEWYRVVLPKDPSGFERVGYVHRSVVKELATEVKRAEGAGSPGPVAVRAEEKTQETPTLSVPSSVAAEEGLYYVSDSGPRRIEAKTPYQTRTGSKLISGLTLGLKPARLNAMLLGLRADLQVAGHPRFYLHLADGESIGEYYLVRFTVKESRGRREIEVGSASFFKLQAGFPEKDLFLLETTRLGAGIYLVTPKSALPGGEYGILQIPQITVGAQTSLTPRKIYDFGVR